MNRALISVYNKKGLEDLVKALEEFRTEIVSSGGTASKIREYGYSKLTEVSEFTGHPESPGGLLKTLHPKIHGGLLLNPEIPEHLAFMNRHGIEPFDLVCVNLYPFERVTTKGANLVEAAENIDIGGPTMIRAAAKAAILYGRITVVLDPSQYPKIIMSLKENNGKIPKKLKRELANEAFKRTARYDTKISNYLEEN
jgi:phosphoribosylaminoimidazolecarboxamide formyltransferase/IMP cyclohydrolase